MFRHRATAFTILLGLATALGVARPVAAQEHGHGDFVVPQSAAASAAQAQGRSLAFPVNSLSQSGITGTARLTPTADDKVAIEVALDGAGTRARPMHVHEGACADMNPIPEIPLTTVTNGASRTELDLSLDELTATPHAIFIHKSTEELPVFVACADLVVANVVAVAPSTGEADADFGPGAALLALGGSLAALGYLMRRRAHALSDG